MDPGAFHDLSRALFWRKRPLCCRCGSGIFKSAATFQDCEVEISDLKDAVSGKETEVAAAEERCTHLVRLGEQRNQEIKTLQAQLVGVQECTYFMILT